MKTILASLSIALIFASAPPAQAQSVPVPIAPLHTFVLPADYPVEAITKNEEGRVRIRLQVEASGQVSACSVIESSGSKSLDETSCEIMTARARFTPAKDRSGKLVQGTHETSIRWSLGEDNGVPPRLNIVTSLWVSCVVGQASNFVGSNLSPDAIVEKSFSGCADAEQLLRNEIGVAALPGGNPSEMIQGLKTQYRTVIREKVAEWRKVLRTPATR